MNLVLIAFSTKYGSNFIKLLNGLQTKDLLEQNKKKSVGIENYQNLKTKLNKGFKYETML